MHSANTFHICRKFFINLRVSSTFHCKSTQQRSIFFIQMQLDGTGFRLIVKFTGNACSKINSTFRTKIYTFKLQVIFVFNPPEVDSTLAASFGFKSASPGQGLSLYPLEWIELINRLHTSIGKSELRNSSVLIVGKLFHCHRAAISTSPRQFPGVIKEI